MNATYVATLVPEVFLEIFLNGDRERASQATKNSKKNLRDLGTKSISARVRQES